MARVEGMPAPSHSPPPDPAVAGDQNPCVAYAMQRFPVLRTTFVRREIEALRALGLRLQLISMRAVLPADTAGDTEAEAFVPQTMYMPANPVSLESISANVWAWLRHPRLSLEHLTWAFGDAGGPGLKRRVRLALQLWRGAVLARRLRSLGNCGHCHAQFADGAATTSLVASRLLGVGFSFSSHTSLETPLLSEKLRHAAFVASISDYDKRRLLIERDPGLAERIHIIHCGIPLADWPFQASAAVAEPFRILSVGALIELKGHDSLIEACGILRDRGRDFRCGIIGAGPQQGALLERIRELGLTDKIRLTGPLPQQEVQRRLRAADVFVLASRTSEQGDTDGIPVSLMEAMATGVPVVSTRVAGIPELVRDGDTGFLGPEAAPRQLADNVLRAVDPSGDRQGVTARARRFIEREFSQMDEAERLQALLLNSMQRKDASASSGADGR